MPTTSLTNRQLFFSDLAHTSSMPLALEVTHAEGIYLHGPNGETYIDFISGIAVSNLGHCHPNVVKAVQEQVVTYMHLMVYGEYIQAPQVQLALLLIQHLPASLNSVYFVNSGAEATEGALKLAKRATQRSQLISCYHSYHGSTHGALSVMGNEFFKQAYRPLLPDVHFIHYGNLPDLELITQRTAAVIIETIQGEAGVRIADTSYFKALRNRCTEMGALLILDEIQTGFGRTGTLWAFEAFGIVPDILLLAKGMGGGMPIGAFVANKTLMQHFQSNPVLGHITTFGGHPVCCAAALATLQTLLDSDFIAQVPAKTAFLREQLQHRHIREVRSAGLMLAVEFESAEIVQQLIQLCLQRGLLVDWFLHNDRCIRMAPPLIITMEQLHQACQIFREALDALP